jgi:RHS repeat-associated protein
LLSTLTPNGSGGEAVQHHHPDRLGTRLVTDPSSGTSFEQVTLPFGTALNAESTGSTTRRFTSYDRSSVTGLDYANNRHYDPQQGRFTQVDPIGMSAASLTDPQSLNMYSYVGNDPVNRTDPTGLFWGKLWRAIKKVLTNKWFIIALTVALAVITIGSAAFGWQLSKAVLWNIGTKAMPIMLPTGATTATTLGWVASGLQATLAISSISFSAKKILVNTLLYAAGIGISQVLSRIPMGTLGPGGTAGFNPNAGLGFAFDAGGVNQGSVDSCHSFANSVAGIAAGVSRDQFLNVLARTFVGVSDSSIASMRNAGTTRAPTNYTSSGFKNQFVDPRDPGGNQVRHYVAGLIAARRLGRRGGLWFMNQRETPGTSDYAADTALNAVSTLHGASLNDPRDLASMIRRDVCK